MPEAPEAETLRRGMESFAIRRLMGPPRVERNRVFRDMESPEMLVGLLDGAIFSSIRRHGKFLILDISKDDLGESAPVLVLHMGMSGQLRASAVGGLQATRVAHAHLTFCFLDQTEVAFIDPRTFGRAYLDHLAGGESLPPTLSHLGPDILTSDNPFSKLRESARSSRVWIKKMLLDQSLVAGIGNMYADEILFRARIDPRREGRSLSRAEFDSLQSSAAEVLNRAVKLGGSSLADRSYRDIGGDLGQFQNEHFAYGREGEPCARCATEIVRIVSGGRSSFLCESCQG